MVAVNVFGGIKMSSLMHRGDLDQAKLEELASEAVPEDITFTSESEKKEYSTAEYQRWKSNSFSQLRGGAVMK